jgi:hypothetical protein
MWDLFGHLEWDPRRWEGFPGDDLYNYTAPLEPVKEEEGERWRVPMLLELVKDDTEDYLDYLAYLAEKAKEEDKVDELPLMP